MSERVTLRHPVTGATWECPARAVDAWLAQGWQRASETTTADVRRRTSKGVSSSDEE